LLALRRRNAGQHHRQGHVLGGGEARHQVEALEHEADAQAAHGGLLVGRQRRDVAAFEAVGPRVGPVEQAQQVEQRGFAGARRSHDRDVFAGSIDTSSPFRACTTLSPRWKTRAMPARRIKLTRSLHPDAAQRR
jgi:hypothetical protein